MKEYTRFSKTGKTSHFDCCVTWVLLYVQVLGPTVITYQKIIPGSTEVSFVLPWRCMQERLPTPISLSPPRSRDRASAEERTSENVATLSCPIPQFRPLQAPKSSTCLLSYDWLAPQSRPSSRNNNNNNNFICAHTKFKCTKVRRTIAWLPEITLLLKIETTNNNKIYWK